MEPYGALYSLYPKAAASAADPWGSFPQGLGEKVEGVLCHMVFERFLFFFNDFKGLSTGFTKTFQRPLNCVWTLTVFQNPFRLVSGIVLLGSCWCSFCLHLVSCFPMVP